MSEHLLYRDDDGEADIRLTAHDRPNGAILLVETINSGVSNQIHVRAQDRPAVALALLGGLSDDLIERCDRAVNDLIQDQERQGFETATDSIVRLVLREAFGLTEPTE